MDIGKSITIGGKNLTLLAIGTNNKMIIQLDDKKYFFSTIELDYNEGLHINPGYYYERTRSTNESIDPALNAIFSHSWR